MSTPHGNSPDDGAAPRQDSSPEQDTRAGQDSRAEQDSRPEPRYGQYAPRGDDQQAVRGTPIQGHGGGDDSGQYNPYGQRPTWGQPHQDTASQNQGGQPSWGHHNWQGHGSQDQGSQDQGYQGQSGSPYQQPGYSPEQSTHAGGTPSGYATAGYPNPGSVQPYGGKPRRAGTLTVALFLLIGAAVSALAWGIYTFADLPMRNPDTIMSPGTQQMFMEQFEADPQFQELNAAEALEAMLLGFGVLALIWGAVVAVIYAVLAFVGTMTGNVGRILATIWVAGSSIMLFFGYDGPSMSLVLATIALGFAAVVMLWLPASNSYVRERRRYKQFQRSGGYSTPGYGTYGDGGQGHGDQPPAPQQPGPYQR